MTVATNANVTKLYIATFDRAPDSDGLNYWVNQSGLSLEQIARSFFDQAETQTKYAGKTNQQFVETIYLNVLGRPGEAAGITYWVGELNAGRITKDQAILAVIGGAQGTDAELLENKTQVGVYFAEHGADNNPDAFAVIDEVTLDPTSVAECKKWIDGNLPAPPSQYFVLDDNRSGYDLTGSAKDDVFVVEAFKNAKIAGGEGSDTLDFQDFSPRGVNVNLSTGVGPNGADGSAMKFEWIENIRGTSGNDTLVGNSDANILVSMGGVDTIDGGVGNDRILFRNISDVAASIINGGQNTDTLEITDQTDISVGAATFANVSDVEILQVGYDEEGSPSAATITVTGGTPLNSFKEIRGTESVDKKGNAASDVIQSGLNLDVSRVKLTSIEELKMTAAETAGPPAAGDITVGKDTLTSVKSVTGHEGSKTTDLVLSASAGDVFDMTKPTFTNIDRVAQIPGPGVTAPVATTVIVNQALINSLASSDGADGFGTALAVAPNVDLGAAGGFTESTLRASGIGLDLGALRDGDTNFKVVEFGTAHEVTIGNINDGDNFDGAVDLTALRTITGSDNNADLLRVLPDFVHAQNLADVSTAAGQQAVTITKVERLDFEETSTVALDNVNLTNVKQLSGDDDRNASASQPALVAAAAALAAAQVALADAVDDAAGGVAATAATTAATAATAAATAATTAGDLTSAFALTNAATALTAAAGAFAGALAAEQAAAPAAATAQNIANNAALNAVARTTIDAGLETDVGGLNLKGITLQDIYGLGNNVSGKNGTVTIDSKTTWDSNFKDLDHDSNQTIIAAEAGSYDFSSIIESTGANVAFAVGTGAPTVTYFDKFVGSDGNDIVKGGTDSFAYTLGKGNDSFFGTDTANESVEGGEGNDTIGLGNNIETTDTLGLSVGGILGLNTSRLINSVGLVGTNDYIASEVLSGALAGTPVVVTDGVVNALTFSRELGGYADGGAGDDVITSSKGDDVLLGGIGNDSIQSGEGRDIIVAGDGADILSGGKNADFMAGGAGDDLLEGNEGDDFLFGGKGRDVMRGDQLDASGKIQYLGRDTFIFEGGDSATTASTVDIIKDFTSTGLATTTDLDGDGNKGGASDLLLTDVISVNWFGTLPAGTTGSFNVATDTTGAATTLASGTAYKTFVFDATNAVAGEATLLDAANKALDNAYNAQTLNTTLGATVYTSQAVQFEYGGKEYVVVDSFVNNAGAATNNYSSMNDVIVEISDAPVLWTIDNDDVIVTRWDSPTL